MYTRWYLHVHLAGFHLPCVHLAGVHLAGPFRELVSADGGGQAAQDS
jgi:hypothetical protein